MEGSANSQVEPFEELGQRFAFAANQHSQAVVSIVCNGDTAHWPDYADGDLAMPNQLSDVGKRLGNQSRPFLRCEAEIL